MDDARELTPNEIDRLPLWRRRLVEWEREADAAYELELLLGDPLAGDAAAASHALAHGFTVTTAPTVTDVAPGDLAGDLQAALRSLDARDVHAIRVHRALPPVRHRRWRDGCAHGMGEQ